MLSRQPKPAQTACSMHAERLLSECYIAQEMLGPEWCPATNFARMRALVLGSAAFAGLSMAVFLCPFVLLLPQAWVGTRKEALIALAVFVFSGLSTALCVRWLWHKLRVADRHVAYVHMRSIISQLGLNRDQVLAALRTQNRPPWLSDSALHELLRCAAA